MPQPSDALHGLLYRLTRRGAAVALLVALAALLFGALGTISTGNVGVRTTLGVISQDEVTPGVYVKWPTVPAGMNLAPLISVPSGR